MEPLLLEEAHIIELSDMHRFEYVVKMNIQSIQACDPSKMASLDMRPHYVSKTQWI